MWTASARYNLVFFFFFFSHWYISSKPLILCLHIQLSLRSVLTTPSIVIYLRGSPLTIRRPEYKDDIKGGLVLLISSMKSWMRDTNQILPVAVLLLFLSCRINSSREVWRASPCSTDGGMSGTVCPRLAFFYLPSFLISRLIQVKQCQFSTSNVRQISGSSSLDSQVIHVLLFLFYLIDAPYLFSMI